MSTLTLINGLIRHSGAALVLSPKPGTSDPCCCEPKKICWTRDRGTLFETTSDDIDIGTGADVTQCAVIVDYFPNQCGAYPYFSASKIIEFLTSGGVYFTNCEWTNCDALNRCDPDGAAFGAHMSAIGCSLARGRGTISTNPSYSAVGGQIFAGCQISGEATAEIVGGTPLVQSYPGSYCPNNETGGIMGAGAKVHNGAVVGFGDSNMRINGAIRENLLNTTIADLF